MADDNLPAKVIFAWIEEPPFATGEDDRVTGADVELARLVVERMGIKEFEPIKVEFADMLPGVAAGRWTMNTALFITPERCRTVAFSDPVWALADGMIVSQGNPRRITSYAAIAADAQAKLAVIRTTIQVDAALREGIPRDRVIEVATQEEALDAIRAGQADAFSATALGHRTVLAKMQSKDLELAQGFQPPSQDGGTAAGYGAFSFARENQAFVTRFNEVLAAYFGSPEHKKAVASYGFTDAEILPAVEMRGRLGELCR